MERCEQNARYEVLKDGTCVETEHAKALPCGDTHFEVTFLCHAHAFEAGFNIPQRTSEETDRAFDELMRDLENVDPAFAEFNWLMFGKKFSV